LLKEKNGDNMIYAVAMSGGVDSSVAAYLLKEQGHQVIGFTMYHFDDTAEPFKRHSISRAIDDARTVCQKLEIEHFTIDLKAEFNHLIIKDFLTQYQNGYTPNPCTLCNPTIKWGLFPEKISQIIQEKYHGQPFLMATGHYARKITIDGKSALIRPLDKKKDQTYMLWRLSQHQLAQTIFPLMDFTKEQIRILAQKAGVPVAEKKDSQDICFIDDDYTKFLLHFISSDTGDMIYHDGSKIGVHKGLIYYTIGQRKGLVPWSKPLYVLKIDAVKNQLVVTDDLSRLESKYFRINQVNLIRENILHHSDDLTVKIRYNSPEEEIAGLTYDNEGLYVELKRSVKSITPGQSAVFYRKDELVGGGIIQSID